MPCWGKNRVKKPVTVRVDPDLLDAARACAAREHRSLTNFIEMSLRGRIGDLSSGAATTRHSRAASSQAGSSRGE
jgi:hypothetical protein